MKISIISIGKIKEKYLKLAIEDYSKRLQKYVDLKIVELQNEKAPENFSYLQEEQVKLKEANKILSNISDEFVVALCIESNQLDSLQFAEFFNKNMINGISKFTFIIGGSLGLHKSVIKRADFCISFSKMTFPHQLIRVFLLEQIYRSQKILNNHPYHK